MLRTPLSSSSVIDLGERFWSLDVEVDVVVQIVRCDVRYKH